MTCRLVTSALILAATLLAPALAAAERATGAQDLFRRGVEALEAERFADAASLFRLSYTMEARPATQCNLATTFDRWGGHEREALEAYRRCAAEDDAGRFRQQALERSMALETQLSGGAPSSPSASAPATNLPIAITWTNLRTQPSCFYFSGPGSLGRRQQLGNQAAYTSRGGQVILDFGSGIVFTGQRQGATVTLTRRSTHEYSGPWIITETIQGAFAGQVLHGIYSYTECNGRRPDTCPGSCTIRAEIAASPR